MTYNGNPKTSWDRTTLNDGDLFEEEFQNLYESLNDVNQRLADLTTELTSAKKAIKLVGEKFWLGEYRAPSVDFPAFCLAESDQDMNGAHWPDLVSYLHGKSLGFGFEPGNTYYSQDARVVSWDVANDIATLTIPGMVTILGGLIEGQSSHTMDGDMSVILDRSYLEYPALYTKYDTYYIKSAVGQSLELDHPFAQNGEANYHTDHEVYPIERKLLEAMDEDLQVHGGLVSNWRTVTLPVDISASLLAGTYEITEVDLANNQFKFKIPDRSETASGVLGTPGTVQFYPHRMPDVISGTTLTPVTNFTRHFSVQGRTFVSPHDEFGEGISGLRRRDRFQGHQHWFKINGSMAEYWLRVSGHGNNISSGSNYSWDNINTHTSYQEYGHDWANGEPRVGHTTDPRSEINYPYIWAGTYNP